MEAQRKVEIDGNWGSTEKTERKDLSYIDGTASENWKHKVKFGDWWQLG
jgi:hypothetical protein